VDVGEHLRSTLRLLQESFPDGLTRGSEDYFAVLAVLHEELSDRNLADAITAFTGGDWGVILNDVWGVVTTNDLSRELRERVLARLREHGYDEWLTEE
jgi:hypothetical protein